MTEEYTAVLDRFEGDVAVLLLECDDETTGELVVERTTLPTEARRQDAVFRVVVEDDELVDVTYDAEATEARREQAQSRFDRLSERPSTERDE